MTQRQQCIDDLHQTALEFITDLGSIFTNQTEKGDLALIEFFYKRLHPDQVMQNAVENLLPYKSKIKKRDINFFVKNKYIFAGLPEDRVIYYGDLIVNSGRLSDEDFSTVWDYLDTMLELTEDFKKRE